jgi:CBS domain-containing protein
MNASPFRAQRARPDRVSLVSRRLLFDRGVRRALAVTHLAAAGVVHRADQGRDASGDGHVGAAVRHGGDVVRFLSDDASAAGTVGSIMTAPALTAQPDEPLEDAAWRLARARFHRPVVTDGDLPVGVLSACDVLEVVREQRIQACIGTLMTTPVETVDIGDTIDTATRKLATSNVHGIVVVDGESPVGVYTHREAIAARRLPPSLRLRPVEDVMSQETICLDVETPIDRAAGYGTSMDVRRLLVVQGRRLVGIVSALDLIGALAPAKGLSGSAGLSASAPAAAAGRRAGW